MKFVEPTQKESSYDDPASAEGDLLGSVLAGAVRHGGNTEPFAGVVVGELIGLADDGHTPLVVFPGQSGSAAVAARTVVDLHGAHVGRQVVLMFDGANREKPIVMGTLCKAEGWPLQSVGDDVEVESDGQRVIVTAKERLVLRCGKASVTLTKEGKVLIQGTYLSQSSSGVNRIRGGSVQIN